LTEFVKNKIIAQRVSYDDIKKRFIFVLFNPDECKLILKLKRIFIYIFQPAPRFYEAEITDYDFNAASDEINQKWLLIKNTSEFLKDKLRASAPTQLRFCYMPSLCVNHLHTEELLAQESST
jgi:hypothetical protein